MRYKIQLIQLLLMTSLLTFLYVTAVMGQDITGEFELPDTYQGQQINLPCDVNTLEFIDFESLSEQQAELLSLNGFMVQPTDFREYSHLYDEMRYSELPVYITTDSVLHVYHLIFNKLLRELEQEELIPALTELTATLTTAAQQQYEESKGTQLEEPCRRVWAYFSVAEQLLEEEGQPIADEIAVLVETELGLIKQHDGIHFSPLMSPPTLFEDSPPIDFAAPLDDSTLYYQEDYSQYTPRGHYSLTEERTRYFRTMMWYGRINFRLAVPTETMQALLVVRLLESSDVGDQTAVEVWESIYEPTCFLVGASDDLSFRELAELCTTFYGSSVPSLDQLDDPAKLDELIVMLKELPSPRINSMWVNIWEDEEEVTHGMRFMGQRFVLDSFIFENLIWRRVGSAGHPRWLPRGLDVFAAFGNDEALAILTELGETEYDNYDTQLQLLRAEIAKQDPDVWNSTLYAKWLQTLMILTEEKGRTYPNYMQTPAWSRKDLHTALGSWTELKHDTVLYSKQVMAEMGDGCEEYTPPLNHVEPNPRAFNALLELAELTRSGLAEHGILTDDIDNLTNSLTEEIRFYRDIAVRELTGAELTIEENDRLLYAGGWLEWMVMSSADLIEDDEYGGFYMDTDEAALATDVATDPNGTVLQEATGRIYKLLVVTPTWDGGAQVSYGGVFSYYEFPWPIEDRLTDGKWREILLDGMQPDRPTWTESFIAN